MVHAIVSTAGVGLEVVSASRSTSRTTASPSTSPKPRGSEEAGDRRVDVVEAECRARRQVFATCHLVDPRGDERRLLGVGRGVRVEPPRQRGVEVVVVGHGVVDALECAGEAAPGPLREDLEHLVLAVEVAVEDPVADVRLGHDVVDARRVEPSPCEHRVARLQQQGVRALRGRAEGVGRIDRSTRREGLLVVLGPSPSTGRRRAHVHGGIDAEQHPVEHLGQRPVQRGRGGCRPARATAARPARRSGWPAPRSRRAGGRGRRGGWDRASSPRSSTGCPRRSDPAPARNR